MATWQAKMGVQWLPHNAAFAAHFLSLGHALRLVSTCHLCHRAAGSLVGRFGADPDPMGGELVVVECECGRDVCGECRDECCETKEPQ